MAQPASTAAAYAACVSDESALAASAGEASPSGKLWYKGSGGQIEVAPLSSHDAAKQAPNTNSQGSGDFSENARINQVLGLKYNGTAASTQPPLGAGNVAPRKLCSTQFSTRGLPRSLLTPALHTVPC